MNDNFIKAINESDSVYVTVVVNCDKELTVKITKKEAKRIAAMPVEILFIKYDDGSVLIDRYGTSVG